MSTTDSATAPNGVSVVIPAFNEEGGIATTLRAIRETLDRSGRKYEIIVVDYRSRRTTPRAPSRPDVRFCAPKFHAHATIASGRWRMMNLPIWCATASPWQVCRSAER